MIINRRTLLASLGLALPAVAAQAATGSHKHKSKSTHTTHASSGKSHHGKSHTTAAKSSPAAPEG